MRGVAENHVEDFAGEGSCEEVCAHSAQGGQQGSQEALTASEVILSLLFCLDGEFPVPSLHISSHAFALCMLIQIIREHLIRDKKRLTMAHMCWQRAACFIWTVLNRPLEIQGVYCWLEYQRN